MIAARTNNGADLVGILLSIARGNRKATPAQQLTAVDMLLDRMVGRPQGSGDMGGLLGALGGDQLTITVRRVDSLEAGAPVIVVEGGPVDEGEGRGVPPSANRADPHPIPSAPPSGN